MYENDNWKKKKIEKWLMIPIKCVNRHITMQIYKQLNNTIEVQTNVLTQYILLFNSHHSCKSMAVQKSNLVLKMILLFEIKRKFKEKKNLFLSMHCTLWEFEHCSHRIGWHIETLDHFVIFVPSIESDKSFSFIQCLTELIICIIFISEKETQRHISSSKFFRFVFFFIIFHTFIHLLFYRSDVMYKAIL